MTGFRAKEQGPLHFGRMIFFSLAIHVLVVSLALFSQGQPRPKWTFGPVYTVALVNLPKGELRQVSALKTAEIRPEAIPRHPAIVLRKPIAMSAAEPLRRLETPKKPAADQAKAVEAPPSRSGLAPAAPAQAGSQEKTAPRDQSPAQAAAGGAAGAAAETGRPQPGVSEGEINRQIQDYYRLLWQNIRQHWTIPPSLVPKENLTATLIVKIARNGTLLDAGFEKKSGHIHFDDSALRALKKASPFSPLPEWIASNDIELGIRFHSSELR